MADETFTSESIFEDGENLQAAIAKALQENKALLCFVYDPEDGHSDEWQAAIIDDSIRVTLQATTVLLRLKACTDQAGFLNGVCPIQSIPTIVIIHNAQVVANYQHGETSLDDLQKNLRTRYGQPRDTEASASSSPSESRRVSHLELPPPDGRMRLPNNAYDELRKVTQDCISKGLTGMQLLETQLLILEKVNIDIVTKAVEDIRRAIETSPNPSLPPEVSDRLLNTPAPRLRTPSSSHENVEEVGWSLNSIPRAQDTTPTLQPPTQSARSPPASSSRPPASNQSRNPTVRQTSSTSPATTSAASAHESQRAQYVAAQQARESAAETERARIKAQITADKAARREAEAQAAAEQRRIDLLNLRKANSTTSDPKASDVRIQVRLFDGSTIRNSFPAEATVAKEVRSWIDGEVSKKAVSGASSSGQPYNLKLILTPLPNRTIEAGEEDGAISDLDGVQGSATMVMVPVRGYVDSYSGSSGGGGGVGGVVGGAANVFGAGIGLVGSAAGMFVGGLGRLLGGGTAPPQQPQQTTRDTPTRDTGDVGTSSGSRRNVRVRTLADQRTDEEDDRRKKGTQLYNGMGLNVQPRKDDEDKET